MSRENKAVFDELRGELESLGIPAPQAERIAHAQAEAAARREGGSSAVPSQHVVPVSRGWLVIRSFASQDGELFATRDEAEARARMLAQESGASVIVHDANGEVEREVQYPAGN